VFFTTRQRLVAQDVDQNSDVYDARVDGGLAGQEQTPAAGCEGDICQGAPSSPPGFASPSSSTLSGVGNLSSPVSAPAVKKAVKHRAKRKPKTKRRKRRGRARRARQGENVSHRAGR
jgi:hypothetical protein